MGELKRGRTPRGARICESRVISEWRAEECRAKETSRCERREGEMKGEREWTEGSEMRGGVPRETHGV